MLSRADGAGRRVREAAGTVVDVDVTRQHVVVADRIGMPCAGVIWMFASTNVFTARPLFGATPFVGDREHRRRR